VASGRFVLGLARFHVGDRRGARTQLEAALRLDPRHARAARALARVQIGDGEPLRALAWLDHAARNHPPDHEAALERAVALAAAGRHAEGVRALDRALAALHRAPLGGPARRDATGPERSDGADGSPKPRDHADRRHGLAMRLVASRPAEAALHLEAALALNPRYLRAHLALGLIELERRRFPDACRELEAARELEPSFLDVRDWLGLARLLCGEARTAVGMLEGLVERHDGFARAQRHLALARHAVGETASAFEAARVGVTCDLDLSEGGRGRWPGFEPDRSCADELARGLSIRPRSPDLHLAIARLHDASGAHAEARRELRLALTLKPSYAAAARALAGTELALGQPRDAERRLSELVEWRPGWVDAQALLGRVRLSLGDVAGAVAPLRAALRERPGLEPARSDLTRAIQGLGRTLRG
jgi:tetratricopeptide (TPR) repeat protein